MNFHEDTKVAANAVHTNDFPFLETTLENIRCGTINAGDDLKCHSLEFGLKKGYQITCY